jgi:hypothetical protein
MRYQYTIYAPNGAEIIKRADGDLIEGECLVLFRRLANGEKEKFASFGMDKILGSSRDLLGPTTLAASQVETYSS